MRGQERYAPRCARRAVSLLSALLVTLGVELGRGVNAAEPAHPADTSRGSLLVPPGQLDATERRFLVVTDPFAEDESALIPPPPASLGGSWGLGPIEFRNEHVISLSHLTITTDSPAVLAPGVWRLSFRGAWAQSIALYDAGPSVIDAETLEAVAALQVGLPGELEIGVELPVVHRTEGVLDPFIRSVETTFSKPRKERVRLEDGQFRLGGHTARGEAFELEKGTGLGKLTLRGKALVTRSGPFGASVSVDVLVALPTGSDGTAASGVDAGVRLSFARRFDDFILYFGGAFVTARGRFGPIELERFKGMGFLAGEYELTEHVSLVYQMWVESPTSRDLEAEPGLILYHGGGLKARFDRTFFEVGILENGADVTVSADVVFHVGVGFLF